MMNTVLFALFLFDRILFKQIFAKFTNLYLVYPAQLQLLFCPPPRPPSMYSVAEAKQGKNGKYRKNAVTMTRTMCFRRGQASGGIGRKIIGIHSEERIDSLNCCYFYIS